MKNESKTRWFIDMDGVIAKWNPVATYDELLAKGYYRDREPDFTILNEVKDLVKKGENVFILSKVLTESDFAKNEKTEWCHENLPEIPDDHLIFVPYEKSKAEYFNELGLTPITKNDYLIDDFSKNLFDWEKSGGIGVKYMNGINGTKGTWTGAKLYDLPLTKNIPSYQFKRQYTLDYFRSVQEDKRFDEWLDLKHKIAENLACLDCYAGHISSDDIHNVKHEYLDMLECGDFDYIVNYVNNEINFEDITSWQKKHYLNILNSLKVLKENSVFYELGEHNANNDIAVYQSRELIYDDSLENDTLSDLNANFVQKNKNTVYFYETTNDGSKRFISSDTLLSEIWQANIQHTLDKFSKNAQKICEPDFGI